MFFFLLIILYTSLVTGKGSAFQSSQTAAVVSKSRVQSTTSIASNNDDDASSLATKIYFDIAISTPKDEITLGRLTFNLTPSTHPYYLPLHISNLISLASSSRKSIDSKATYEGCTFQYSPAAIEDGSLRYKWGHVMVGNQRNAIQTKSVSGEELGYDEPFSDPQRVKECSHSSFGGVYYGQSYEEIVELLAKDGQDIVVVLTVPIQGPGSGTSKFSIVRVSESPQEWGERLLHNSAIVGYLDCNAPADSSFMDGDRTDEGDPTGLDVLQAMARQTVGPPKIISSGVI